MRLTLEAIHIIDTIALTGSFSAAAQRLHKVPSTISYTITKLEEQMDMQFFDRNGPHISLTPIGQELLEEGRCLLSAAHDLEKSLYKIQQGDELELTIALDGLIPLSALTNDLRAFTASNHTTRLKFQHEVLTGTWEALIDRRADLVIAAGSGPAGGRYKTYLLGSLDFIFCVAPHHPLANEKTPLTRSQLLQHTAITIADSSRQFAPRTTGLYEGQKVISVHSLADKIILQKSGLGHGFLPKVYIEDALSKEELIEKTVTIPKPQEHFYLAWRAENIGRALSWWIERLSRPWVPEALKG